MTTSPAKLRKLLHDYMSQADLPPICAKIRETRVRLKEQALATGGREAASEFSQERVAQRLHITREAYRAYESYREPGFVRRQQIAKALGLEDDYFDPTEVEEDRLRAVVQEELQEFRDQMARIEALLRLLGPEPD